MMNGLYLPTPAIPWLAAMVLGATAHVGWLTHDCSVARDLDAARPPQVVVVEANPCETTCETTPARLSVAARHATATRSPKKVPHPLRETAMRCTGERNCSISRAELDKHLQRPSELARHARIVPSVEDGQYIGFKIYGIRRGSIPKLLGVHNGDLLTSVNGHRLGSVDDAMSAFRSVGKASERTVISFGLERKGEHLDGVLRVRDHSGCSRQSYDANYAL